MTAQIITCLNFNGNAEEAMRFYQQCLGGELIMQKIAESPMGITMTSEMGAKILYGSLLNENMQLMAADKISEAVVNEDVITLLVNCCSDEEIHRLFENLSKGGIVMHPIHQSFGGATSGELTDKFGIQWKLSYSKK